MGNCTASQRAAESWADDGEWEEEEEASSSSEGEHHHHHHGRREDHHDHDSEVTIRITKRQLHELMEKNGSSGHGGLPLPGFGSGRRSAEQLLADIMNSGEVHHRDHHREEHWHWKPALQSIPEAVESSRHVHESDLSVFGGSVIQSSSSSPCSV